MSRMQRSTGCRPGRVTAGMRTSGRVIVWSWSMTMPGSSWPVTISGPGSRPSATGLGRAFAVSGWTFPPMTRPARSPDAAGRSGRVGDGRHPGSSGEGVADGGQDVGAVLGGGGDIAADGVPGAGDLLGAEPAGDLLLGLSGPQIAFRLIRRRRDPQVGGEPEPVVLPVAQAFEQVAAGLLLAAGNARDLGQADQDAMPERVDQGRGSLAGNGGKALG